MSQQPAKSPFEFDDSDIEDNASNNYEMRNWSPNSRRRPPPVPPAPAKRKTDTHVGSSGSQIPDTSGSYGYEYDDYFDDNGQPAKRTSKQESYANASGYLDTKMTDGGFSSVSSPEKLGYRPSYESQASGYQPSVQSSTRPFEDNNYQGFPFQQFQRDYDEPEIYDQVDFVAEEKQLEQQQRQAYQKEVEQRQLMQQSVGSLPANGFTQPANVAGTETVRLLNGKYYSFDYPVAQSLLKRIPFPGASDLAEFKYVRYHAITADPKEYKPSNPEAVDYIENYPLRHKWYAQPRETELMIVCTMYNENDILLARTLKGVFKNIKKMYKGSEPFGKNAWKKIVVVVVADGRNKLNERSKALLTLLGCYQDGVIQEKVNGKDVKAHLFEYTTTFGIGKFDYGSSVGSKSADSPKIPLVTEQTIPVQMMFLLKEHNAQKINSHRWAFNFLCPNLRPKIICLVDVGTEPGPDSIYKLYEAFKDPKVAGVCGEIRAMLGRHASANDEASFMGKIGRWIWAKACDFGYCVINPLVAAQNFEYKMSNILDKPTESVYGFVSVLPGAFSAYRYTALQGDPLQAYFHGEDMKTDAKKPAGVLESNMYLAEDRILCYQLVSKPRCAWLLQYVHDSYAVTDVPGKVNEFINQRRRWLNGSFFAALYSLIHFYRILRSGHSPGRKFLLVIEMLYQFLSIILSWFSLATYFLIFRILTLQVVGTPIGFKAGNILAVVFLWIYIITSALTFIISFGNKPNENKRLYQIAFGLYTLIAIYMLFCVIILTENSIVAIKDDIAASADPKNPLTYLKNATFRDLTISLASTYVLYIFSSLIFCDMFHLFACTIPYLLLNPAYVNVLSIYAFCNIDDISWGTKGAVKGSDGPKKEANVVKQDDKSSSSDADVLQLSEALKNPDKMYNEAQQELESSDDGTREHKDSNLKLSRKNYAKGRTYAVLLWLISNFALLVVVLRTGGLDDFITIKGENYGQVSSQMGSSSSSGSGSNSQSSSGAANGQLLSKRQYDTETATIFMTVILWIVAAMSLFRFIACIWYRLDFAIRRRRYHRSQVYY